MQISTLNVIIGCILSFVLVVIGWHIQPFFLKKIEKTKGELSKPTYLDNIEFNLSFIQVLEMASGKKLTDIYVPLKLVESYDRVRDIPLSEDTNEKDIEAIINLDHLSEYSPEEVLKNSQRSFIIAELGAGKTTIAKTLALQVKDDYCNHNVQMFPIFIEVAQFIASDNSIISYVKNNYNWKDCDVILEQMLEEGFCTIFFDGLDEAGQKVGISDQNRSMDKAIYAINNIVKKYPKCKYLVFSRINCGVLEGFKKFNIKRFTGEDINTFIDKWFDDRAKGRDFENQLLNNPIIYSYAKSPLLLVSLAVVFEQDLEIPSKISEVQKRCLEILLSKWDTSRNIRRESRLSKEEKRILLKELAFMLHEQNIRYVKKQDLIKLIKGILPDFGKKEDVADIVFEELSKMHGLLLDLPNEFSCFSHLSFQEYFTAEYCHEYLDDAYILGKISDPWWHRVIATYSSITNSTSLLKQLTTTPDDSYNNTLFMAGECLIESYRIESTLRKEIIDKIINVTLKDRPFIEPKSNRGAFILSRIVNDELSETLKQIALGKYSRKQRLLASKIIVEGLPSIESSKIVIEIYKSSSRKMRSLFAEMLGRIGTKECSELLLDEFGKFDNTFSMECGVALQDIQIQSYNPKIERFFVRGVPEIYKLRTVQFAHRFPCKETKSYLKKVHNDKNEDMIIRIISLTSLLKTFNNYEKDSFLLDFKKNNKVPWQFKAAVSLELNNAFDLDEFSFNAKEMLLNKNKPMDKWFAGIVLIRNRTNLDIINEIIFSKNENILLKHNLVLTLENWPSQEVFELLIAVMCDQNLDIDIRKDAIGVLQNQGAVIALPKLKKLYEEKHTSHYKEYLPLKNAAIKAIGYIGREKEIDYLLNAYEKEKDPLGKMNVSEALYVATGGCSCAKVLNATAVAKES